MELTEHRCKRCGGALKPVEDNRWKCQYCGSVYDDESASRNTKSMRELFDEAKQELINNLRRNLYDAVNAEYISSTDVKNACNDIKKYLPDDFHANFYEVAVSNNVKKITQYIRKLDVESNYEEIECAVRFLIKSLQVEYLLELNNLVERAYKQKDLQLYERFATEVSVEAEKVQMGIYETKLPREVFVAYSSKDMSKVSELVEVLESQGLKCFVAARNLRHGKGSVENYDKALKEAMDHCKSFVFVSTLNSRSLSCDALEIEVPYIQSRDTENAPAEFRNNYAAIPHRFKKPRVEYRIEESRGFNAADEITNEFFDGYERVYSPEEVAKRIMKQIVSVPGERPVAGAPRGASSASSKKYCVSCGQENSVETNFCTKCGKSDFVADISEFIKIKNQKDIIARARKLEEEKRMRASGQPTVTAHGAKAAEAPKDQEAPKATEKASEPKASFSIPVTPPSYTKPPEVKSPYAPSGTAASSSSAKYSSVSSGKGKKSKTGIIVAAVLSVVVIVAIILGMNGCPKKDTQTPVYEETLLNGFETEQVTDNFGNSYDSNNALSSGSFDGFTYLLDQSGMLVINGSGIMPSFEYASDAPWYDYYSEIKQISVSDGIESIGKNAFRDCYNLTDVYLSKSVASIGAHAFEGCSMLNNINVDRVSDIGEYAFAYCSSIYSLDLYDDIEHVGVNAFISTGLMSDFESWYSDYVYVDNCLVVVRTNASGHFEIDYGTVCIADDAFRDCSAVTGVGIPDTVEYIGNNAFWSCSSLESVNIPDSVSSIGTNAFSYCEALASVTFADSIDIESIGSYAFAYNDNLSYVVLPASGSFNSIGDFMFYDCDGLVEVVIPATVTRIEQYAFADCEKLKNVIIPIEMTFIGQSAFYSCYYLESIMYMGTQEGWDSIRFGADWSASAGSNTSNGTCSLVYLNGEYDSNDSEVGTPGLEYSANESGDAYIVSRYQGDQTEIVIPSKHNGLPVVGIAAQAFYNCSEITSVVIPASVTEIGESAFGYCYALTSVTFGDGIQLSTIPVGAFQYCYSMKSIVIPASVGSIGNNAFMGCEGLEIVLFVSESQLYEVGSEAFSDCKTLSEIMLPDSIKRIDYCAFKNTAITKTPYTESCSLEFIGDSAFNYCQSLTEVLVPATVENNGCNFFTDCSYISKATVPTWVIRYIYYGPLETLIVNGGDTIEENLFENRNDLRTVVLGDSVTGIGYRAFCDSGIVSITMSDNVTFIGEQAFYGCVNLETFTLPAGVTEIYPNSFRGCTALKTIDLGSNITAIGDYAFSECSNLNNVVIPASVKSIGPNAFSSCGALDSITFSENGSLSVIDSNAFYNCSVLKTVRIPASVETLGNGAFSCCGVLESVEFADGSVLKTIGYNAFQECYALREIHIPDGVTSIEYGVFYSCSNLETITIPNSVESYGDNIFMNCDAIKYVKAPLEAYSYFYHTYLIEAEITSGGKITANAFNGNGSLKRVVIGEGVTGIGSEAFANCYKLHDVVLPESLENIADNAFYDCYSITTITLPSGIQGVMPGAFRGCSRLVEIINLSNTIDSEEFYNDAKSVIPNLKVVHSGESILDTVDGFEFITVDDVTYFVFYNGEETEVVMPESYNGGLYTTIGSVFYGQEITSLTVNGMETIPDALFQANHPSLKHVVIGDSVNSIGNGAFSGCSYLESVVIGNNVVTISDSAFNGCASLTSVTLGEGVTTIGKYAFINCHSLEKIVIPASVTKIDMQAFSGCDSLENVMFRDTTGWYLPDYNDEENPFSISTNVAINAQKLKADYTNYVWLK